ncbi:MAG: hotdog fold thioesterase [Chloracidobacterium sp.]|uniref:Hotdog fold thioesterase n=1 Tax=Chloracidobacterium validum TaxID=2821543 RepID=A0ABX8BCF7_9BACT|nr:hotdog fold thioesterase [Chloracidobacterium validum]QUW04097.1 hotdog fold thioesterase [Chloracidobacterium validum]
MNEQSLAVFPSDAAPANLSSARTGLAAHLGIEFTEASPTFLRARMPVDERTKQPFGLLHGGASVALAETLGSVASHLVSPERMIVGLEINANHIRAARDGYVHGTVTALHIGSSTHVWDIKIRDDDGRLVCVSRLTIAVLNRPTPPPMV